MFLWCRKNSKELVFPVFFLATFGKKKVLDERMLDERETKERSQRDFENSHSSTRTIII